MDIYKIHDIAELIRGNSYVGRGIVLGKSEDGKSAVSAYFIMGRSANSRNRIFTVKRSPSTLPRSKTPASSSTRRSEAIRTT